MKNFRTSHLLEKKLDFQNHRLTIPKSPKHCLSTHAPFAWSLTPFLAELMKSQKNEEKPGLLRFNGAGQEVLVTAQSCGGT